MTGDPVIAEDVAISCSPSPTVRVPAIVAVAGVAVVATAAMKLAATSVPSLTRVAHPSSVDWLDACANARNRSVARSWVTDSEATDIAPM